jgi:site-specific DNA-methyltransferase (adenine-specific)/site-specific DNA-methyltransferase (cytosine-N4-specific)
MANRMQRQLFDSDHSRNGNGIDDRFVNGAAKHTEGVCGKVYLGDALPILRTFPDSQFQMCVTSPPYWGLRDYGIEGQIGAEQTVDGYIQHLVAIFQEVRRTLAPDGVLWLNIGDSYTSGGRTWRQPDKKNRARGMDYRAPTPEGLKPKDLIGVPWRLAFALQADGWYLRSDIIWHKPNALPESVKDRPSRVHEYVFLFSRSEKYFYDHNAVKEPAINGAMRNCRSVWSINTEPFADAHFATFPRQLVVPCVMAGSRKGSLVLDPFFGSGTVGEVCAANERHFVGLELNREYVAIARRRLQKLRNLSLEVVTEEKTSTKHGPGTPASEVA